MESSALIKKEDSVAVKICRWCLTADDALEALTRADSGQCNLQKLSECTAAQIEFSLGVPSYLCTMCEARLKEIDQFRWRSNEKNDLVDRLIEQQNTAKNEIEINLDHSAEQTVGTELSVKTEATSPDAAKDLHLNQKCFAVHQANMTYECCGHISDDLFEAEENPIAIKSENEEVDEQHQLQTTKDVMDHEQDTLKTNPLESICQDEKSKGTVTMADNACTDDSTAESIQNVLSPGTRNVRSKSQYKKHKHQCAHCSATYPVLSLLKVHIRTHTDERSHQCKVCDKVFHSSGNLAKHSKIHNKYQQHQCPHCSSMFVQSSKLKIHIRTHTGERPYNCKVCDQAFRTSGHLTKHSKIHNKDQQHQCPHCSSRFAQSTSLKNHIRTHTGEKPYQCKVCDKAFHSSSILVQHSKTHNKDKRHQCPHCSSRFAQSSSLKNHIRTHTGEKPYQCKVCDKAFNKSSNLVRHSKIHKKREAH